MEFGKHLGKGAWAFADKSLPALYGIGLIFLVYRLLPPIEVAKFGIFQMLFTIGTALMNAIALQSMVKFASETDENGHYLFAGLGMSAIGYVLLSIIVIALRHFIIPIIDSTGEAKNLDTLFFYLPGIFVSTWFRNFVIYYLQSRYEIRKIFWIDAVYYFGVLILIMSAKAAHHYSTAEDLIRLSILALSCSSFISLLFYHFARPPRFDIAQTAFSKLWHFGKFTFLGTTNYLIFSQMDILFVSTFAGILAVATYTAAKIFMKFFDMLNQVLQLFLIPFSSRAHAQNDIPRLTSTAEKAICFSMLVALPVLVVMLIIPGLTLHIIYSGRYDQGASIVRVLALLGLIYPWNAVISSYITGMARLNQILTASVLLIVIAVPCYLLFTPIMGGAGTALGLVAGFLITTFYIYHDIRKVIPITVKGVVMRVNDVWSFAISKVS